MTLGQRRVTDASEMRALAHPLRLRLLELLGSEGAMTASEAGRRLDETPANVSWHLRQLARHGFVRQTTGSGRERPWKFVAQALTFGEDAEDPTAATALRDVLLEREFQVLRASLGNQRNEGEDWQQATSIVQSRLWLTAEEADRISSALRDVLTDEALLERLQEPERRPSGARLMAAVTWVVPCGPAPAASSAAEGTSEATR